jgi:integrase
VILHYSVVQQTHRQEQQQFSSTSVNTFLNSIGLNSKNSRKAYHTGLMHFENFLKKEYKLKSESVILSLLRKDQKINVYELLNNFVSYLNSNTTVSSLTIQLYVAAVRSYLEFCDIDIVPSKFRRRVKIPKYYREDEYPIDVHEIRKLLLKCTNRRLKAYLLVLASSGMRPIEACALRIKDVDFTVTPIKVHVRKEYNKTRRSRDVYISEEATHYLKDLIKWKYKEKIPDPNDLVFSIYFIKNANPERIYARLVQLFQRLLAACELDQKKDNSPRRKITPHSFRRFVKTVISDQVGQDYSEWFLGHAKSPYYTKKEIDRKEIYATKCMKYLTFLDYTTLEARGKSIEVKLREKDRELHDIKEKYESEIESIREETTQKFNQIMAMIQQNPQLAQVKPEVLTNKGI